MNKYSIKNIKSFKDEAVIDIKPITIFVGKNSSGKSSLIRFPVVISQSMNSDADTPILFFERNLDYGNYEDVVYDHKRRGKIVFSVEYECHPGMYFYRISRENKYSKLLNLPTRTNFRVGLIKYSRKTIVDTCDIAINEKRSISITRMQNEKYSITLFDLDEQELLTYSPKHLMLNKFIPILTIENAYDQIVEAFCVKNGISDIEKKRLKNLKKKVFERSYTSQTFKADASSEDETSFDSLVQLMDYYSTVILSSRAQAMMDAENTCYIGPFRENPSRVYRDVERQVDSVGVKGEYVSAMLKNDFSHGKIILSGVSKWFENSMNYRVTLKDIGSGLYNIVVVKDDGTKDNLMDVGYGISQVLPIVAQLIKLRIQPKKSLYFGKESINSTFIIEQPELHLHPNAQAELATLFVDAIEKNNENNTISVLIETHSEHFIRKLQALIADKSTSITNEDVKIYYVDKNDSNEAFVTEMKILPNGQFETKWPTGFFDKAYELSLELMNNNYK